MRLSLFIDECGPLRESLNTTTYQGAIRLPRRLGNWLPSTLRAEEHLEMWRLLLEGDLHDLLDRANEFKRRYSAYRRRDKTRWHVGDPCYVNGEGHGELLFIQALEPACVIVDGARESSWKAYRPTFLELFRHLQDLPTRSEYPAYQMGLYQKLDRFLS